MWNPPAAGADDRFLVALAVLAVLAEVAEEAPLLCLVDDAHWIDHASITALVFVARRLAAQATCAGVRDPRRGDARGSACGLPELVLQGLDAGTAGELLSACGAGEVHSPFYEASVEKTYGNNPTQANKLLDEAGWSTKDGEGFRTKDGKRLTARIVLSAPFVRDKRDILAQAVQAAVKQTAGIDLQVKVVDQGTATDAIAKGEFEVFDNSRADTEAGAALNLIVPKGAPINRHGFSDPEVEKLIVEAQATSDPAKRKAAYSTIQKVYTDQAVLLPLYAPADQVASLKKVGGVGFEPTAGVPASAYNVWIGK